MTQEKKKKKKRNQTISFCVIRSVKKRRENFFKAHTQNLQTTKIHSGEKKGYIQTITQK